MNKEKEKQLRDIRVADDYNIQLQKWMDEEDLNKIIDFIDKNYISKEEVREKIEKTIKHYEELREEIRSMRESNRNETRIIDSEQTEFAKALCGHYECLMCGNMVNGFNKYCPHCGRINKDY